MKEGSRFDPLNTESILVVPEGRVASGQHDPRVSMCWGSVLPLSHSPCPVCFTSHCSTTTSRCENLLVELTLIESELLALQNVTIAATRLAGAGGDNSIQATSLELLLKSGVDLAATLLEALSLLLLDALGALGLLDSLALLLLAAAAEQLAVVGLVPLAEGGGVDLDDGGLGQGVCAHELVVAGVVDDADDADLAGRALGGPREVARVEAQRAVLVVAAARANRVDALGADLGLGWLAAALENALLPC